MVFYEELNKAVALIKMGQLNRGEIILRDLLKKYPGNTNIQLELGHLLVRREESQEEGKALLEDLLVSKKRKDAMAVLGQLEKMNGNIRLAQYYFKTLIGSKYSEPALIELGLIEKYLGNLENAKNYFEKVSLEDDMRKVSSYPLQALRQRIFIEIKQERFSEAYLLFHQLLECSKFSKFDLSDIEQLNFYLKYQLNILTEDDRKKMENRFRSYFSL